MVPRLSPDENSLVYRWKTITVLPRPKSDIHWRVNAAQEEEERWLSFIDLVEFYQYFQAQYKPINYPDIVIAFRYGRLVELI